MRRFSFLDRLTGDKNKNVQQSDFDKQMAAIRSGDAESVECNETFSDDNIADICLAVQSSETVTSFKIKNVSIEPSIEFLASLCSTTKRLTELRLSNAGINEHESNCLIAALLTNKSVRLLAVDHNNITSAEQWAQLLKINKTIESLDLSFNHLCTVKGSDTTMEMIGTSLVGNLKLRDLYLAGNGIQDSSVRKFLKVIRDNGDDMGLRSLDLVNDSTLPTSLRDELSTLMARPAARVNGLKKARDAEDIDQQQQPKSVTPQKQSSHQQQESIIVNANEPSPNTRGASLVSTSAKENNNHNNIDDDVVSNSSMSNVDESSSLNANNNNNQELENHSFTSSGAGGDAAARAAKLQKLQQMKSKHQADLAKRDQTEKELRESLAQLQTLVEKLKKDVATAQEATRVAVLEQQQQAATALAAAVATVSHNSESSSSSSATQQLTSAFEEKDKQSQKQIQKLTSLLDEMAKKHNDEMEQQDQKLHQQQMIHQQKYEQLSGVVAALTAENEQGDVQIACIKRDMDSAKINFDKEIERMKKVYQDKEKELSAKYDQDRQEYVDNSKLLQSQFEAASVRADALVAANHKLANEAGQQISSLRSQLEVAIASSISPIAGFFDDAHVGGGSHKSVAALSNIAIKTDAIIQTEPLPSFSSRPNNSGSTNNNAPPIPSMDISSVTRFKMPENGIPKPSSDDSFVGDSDDENDEGNVNGGQGSLPGGKPKYLAKNKWIPDEKVHECRACKNKFGVFLRKHHCRICGHVFCDDCAPVNKFDKQRVCHMCASSQHSSLFVS